MDNLELATHRLPDLPKPTVFWTVHDSGTHGVPVNGFTGHQMREYARQAVYEAGADPGVRLLPVEEPPSLHLAGNFRALLHRHAQTLSEPMRGAVERAAELIDRQRLEVERLSAALGSLPRHQFWGAGESDCPPELKAPNGELHTMRCKVCGDGWRKSDNVCFGPRG